MIFKFHFLWLLKILAKRIRISHVQEYKTENFQKFKISQGSNNKNKNPFDSLANFTGLHMVILFDFYLNINFTSVIFFIFYFFKSIHNNVVNPSPMLSHTIGDSFIISPIMDECAVDLAGTSASTLISRGDLNVQTDEAGSLSLLYCPEYITSQSFHYTKGITTLIKESHSLVRSSEI